jgi:carbamoyl-phosphate synthase small subunit
MPSAKTSSRPAKSGQGRSVSPAPAWGSRPKTARLVLADGTVIEGYGLGATGKAPGEVCFNTAITGYQEILTDPSYAGQIITFTFPHIGNVGANDEDIETSNLASSSGRARLRAQGRHHQPVQLPRRKTPGRLAEGPRHHRHCRHRHARAHRPDPRKGHGQCRHRPQPEGQFQHRRSQESAAEWPGLEGMDLAKEVSATQRYDWMRNCGSGTRAMRRQSEPRFNVVAMDFGAKRNILRLPGRAGLQGDGVPATTSAEDILAMNPDGVFLSNGPGDPAATGEYAVPEIRKLVDSGKPVFGICLGHQMLALALGGKTVKMHQGHHGANHPVKDHTTGKVEITSMNHGFAVDRDSLPANVEETHVSLFDGSNCGIQLKGKPVYSVQHHPEASPGPQDSHYLFKRFADYMEKAKG